MELAKAGHAGRSDALRVTCPKSVQERAIALVEEQNAVDVVRRAEVSRQPGPECPHVRMKQAKGVASVALQVDFSDFLHAGDVGAEYVLDRTKQFQTAFPCRRENGGNDVELAVVRRAGLLQRGILIELRVRRGVVTAVKGLLVGLGFSVVGERLPWNLSPRQPATVVQSREDNRIDPPALLQDVQDLFNAFVCKRNRADLYPNHLLPTLGGGDGPGWGGGCGKCDSGCSQKISAGHRGYAFHRCSMSQG